MRAVFTPPFDCPTGDFRGIALFEPEHRLPSDVDVVLLPADRFEALLTLWRRQADILQRNKRVSEAKRVQECLHGVEALFAHASFDTTTSRRAG